MGNTEAGNDLQSLSVLVIEDDAMISFLLEDMLSELGCRMIGPAADLDQATALAQSAERIDLAILDVNVRGRPVFSVAHILSKRGVPLVFASGYGAAGIPRGWEGHPSVQKPFSLEQLAGALRASLAERRPI